MANERHKRVDQDFQGLLDKARANSARTAEDRARADSAQMPLRVAQILAPLLASGVGAGAAGLATGGNPAAMMAGGSAGGAAGTGASSLIDLLLADANKDIRRREQEQAGQSAALSSVLRR